MDGSQLTLSLQARSQKVAADKLKKAMMVSSGMGVSLTMANALMSFISLSHTHTHAHTHTYSHVSNNEKWVDQHDDDYDNDMPSMHNSLTYFVKFECDKLGISFIIEESKK